MASLPKPKKCTGRLELIIGPMFSGKTTEMFRRIKRYTAAGRQCGVLKFAHDARYSKEHAASHDRELMLAQTVSLLSQGEALGLANQVIGIDEGQFYKDLVEWVTHMVSLGKTVVVAALDGTYQQKAFGSVLDLVPLADDVTKLSAVCSLCGADAPFSRRITAETEVNVVGGADKYIAVCRGCLNEPIEGPDDSPSKLRNYQLSLKRLDELCIRSK